MGKAAELNVRVYLCEWNEPRFLRWSLAMSARCPRDAQRYIGMKYLACERRCINTAYFNMYEFPRWNIYSHSRYEEI